MFFKRDLPFDFPSSIEPYVINFSLLSCFNICPIIFPLLDWICLWRIFIPILTRIKSFGTFKPVRILLFSGNTTFQKLTIFLSVQLIRHMVRVCTITIFHTNVWMKLISELWFNLLKVGSLVTVKGSLCLQNPFNISLFLLPSSFIVLHNKMFAVVSISFYPKSYWLGCLVILVLFLLILMLCTFRWYFLEVALLNLIHFLQVDASNQQSVTYLQFLPLEGGCICTG